MDTLLFEIQNTIKNILGDTINTISTADKSGLLTFVGLVISPLVSFIIMAITLHNQNKKFEFERKMNEQQRLEDRKYDEEKLKKTLDAQDEINRISIMPYFVIEEAMFSYNGNETIIDLVLKNFGNGTAIQLFSIVTEKKEESMKPCFDFYQELEITNQIVRVNEASKIKIIQKRKEWVYYNQDDIILDINLSFIDMKRRNYSQSLYLILKKDSGKNKYTYNKMSIIPKYLPN